MKVCDLTQSYSSVGGGIRTYLHAKRRFIEDRTTDEHVLIVPGPEDRVVRDGRMTTHYVASPPVPTSPHYRLLLRSRRVREILRAERPDVIETLDAYNLPWAALRYRDRTAPGTAVIAGYRTDFPKAYVEPIVRSVTGRWVAARARRVAYQYAGALYRRMDAVYSLTARTASQLHDLDVEPVDVLPLGVDTEWFSPVHRSERVRRSFGAEPDDPVLIYVGRLDGEKRPQTVIDAYRLLPEHLRAHLVLVGEGPLREAFEGLGEADDRLHVLGFVRDRQRLAGLLASADVYVSAMPHETFGISIIEAQACGLPVVGVRAGAMVDRVPETVGRLGPVDDAEAMAQNVLGVLEDRAAMAVRARELVESTFSWDRTFETLYALYDRVLAPTHPEPGGDGVTSGLSPEPQVARAS